MSNHETCDDASVRTILFNKPYDVLSQFTDATGRPSLADYITVRDVYPAGRLDRDSEGLLILTDNGALQARITDPRQKLDKTYWVQVEGDASDDQLETLRHGRATRPSDFGRRSRRRGSK